MDYNCFPEYINFKDYLIQYKCLLCNKNSHRTFDEKLKERFFNTYQFSNHNNNKFIIAQRCLPLWIYEWLGKI